jgi:hypothetical protein
MTSTAQAGATFIDHETDRALFRNAGCMLSALPEEPALALRQLEHLAAMVRLGAEATGQQAPEPATLVDAGSNVLLFTAR